jgi:hypothetical protein
VKRATNLMVLALLVLVLGACAGVKNLLHKPHARTSEQDLGTLNVAASQQAGYAVGNNEVAAQYAGVRAGLLPEGMKPSEAQLQLEIAYLDEQIAQLEAHIARLEAQSLINQPDANSVRETAQLKTQIQALLAQINSLQTQTVQHEASATTTWTPKFRDTLRTFYNNNGYSYSFETFVSKIRPQISNPDRIIAGKTYTVPMPPSGTLRASRDSSGTVNISNGVSSAAVNGLQDRVKELEGLLDQAIATKAAAVQEAATKAAADARTQLRAQLDKDLIGPLQKENSEIAAQRNAANAALAAALKRTWRFWAIIILIIVLVIIVVLLAVSRHKRTKHSEDLQKKATDLQTNLEKANTSTGNANAKQKKAEEDTLNAQANQRIAERQRDEAFTERDQLQQEIGTLREQFAEPAKLVDEIADLKTQLAEQQAMIDEHFITFILDPGENAQVRFIDLSGKNRTKIYLPRSGKNNVKIEKTTVGMKPEDVAQYLHRSASGRTYLQIELHPATIPTDATTPVAVAS